MEPQIQLAAREKDAADAYQEFFPQKTYTYKRWPIKINKEYIKFLKLHQKETLECEVTRAKNFYVSMAAALKHKKNRSQCKSHHIKMMKSHGTIDQVIEFFDSLYQDCNSGAPGVVCDESVGKSCEKGPDSPKGSTFMGQILQLEQESLPLAEFSLYQDAFILKDLFDELIE